MKKKKKVFIVITLVAVLLISAAIGIYFWKEKNNNFSISDLDKNYNDLSDFKLESPFDNDALNTYAIRSLSTEEHIGIDFFGKYGVETIPFLAMIEGIVTHIQPKIMENQNGTDNWAFEIWISINSEYMILLNFETFGQGDEVKNLQEKNLFIKVGDYVKKGDLIGNLIICQESAHVHFSLKKENVPDSESFLIPEPYFSEAAMTLINNVYFGRV